VDWEKPDPATFNTKKTKIPQRPIFFHFVWEILEALATKVALHYGQSAPAYILYPSIKMALLAVSKGAHACSPY
jgi:hypothetical protein